MGQGSLQGTGKDRQVSDDRADGGAYRRRLDRRIRRLIVIAKLALFWERLWPALWPAVALAGIFIFFALFGVIGSLPVSIHWALLFALAGAGIFLLWQGLKELRWPGRDEALRRIEAESNLSHQPLSGLEDVAAAGSGSGALWRAHQRRIMGLVSKLRTGWPSPGMAAGDPYALRAALGLLLVIAVAGTPDGRWQRFKEALLPGLIDVKPMRIEAWITPPTYTGIAPIYLSGEGHQPKEGAEISIPVRSVLSIRVNGTRAMPNLNADAARGEVPAPGEFRTLGDASYALDYPVTGSAAIRLVSGGRVIGHWDLAAIPDHPPVIAFSQDLTRTATGALRFAYKASDDYGVTSASVGIRVDRPDAAPTADEAGETQAEIEAGKEAMRGLIHQPVARVLPPQVSLDLTGRDPRTISGSTIKDLTSHPWAGLPVVVTPEARDGAGQEARGPSVRISLPERAFTKPLAQAIIEQRRRLALEPGARMNVARTLNDLTRNAGVSEKPELFVQDFRVYLALRSAFWRLVIAKRDEDLDGIYDLLWAAALRVEDGDLSLAEQALRDAQDRLKQAVEKGADSKEIARLMAEFRQAMQRFFAAAKASGANPQMTADGHSPDMKTISEDQLQQMMKALSDALQSGATQQANELLAQLQNILGNMQSGGSGQMSPAQQAMQKAVERIGRLTRDQQQLMDQTFPRADGAGGQENMGQAGESKGNPSKDDMDRFARHMNALAQSQQALRQELEDVLRQLGTTGAPSPDALTQAGQSMQGAEAEIGQGRGDRAVNQQGKAIDHLKEGAQALASQLAQSGFGQNGRSGADPMGRPLSDQGPDGVGDVAVPDHIDAQKAREILQELRRRASEVGRPKVELDYIDRLLRQF